MNWVWWGKRQGHCVYEDAEPRPWFNSEKIVAFQQRSGWGNKQKVVIGENSHANPLTAACLLEAS